MISSLFSKIFRSSFLWGGLASFAFYALIQNGVVRDETVVRYCAMHPVEYAITIMFFVGMAGLCIKFFDIRQHWSRLKKGTILEPVGTTKLECSQAMPLLSVVAANVKRFGASLHASRLTAILNNIRHADSTKNLDEDIRCYADDDYARAEGDYGLTKMIIWAIPILGFLGTVIGIAVAMGNLAPEALEESLPEVMAGLTIAFDTTALALALSMIVYFTQFLLWRDEQKMLEYVSQLVELELRGRFETQSNGNDNGQLVAVRMMIEVVLETLQDLIQRQADIWDHAISASHSRYAMLASESATQMKSTLTQGLRESVEMHAKELAKAEQTLLLDSKKQMGDVAKNIEHSLTTMKEFQTGMVRQAEILRDVISATGEVTKLEERLNHNLASLAEARYFEETLNSLAAAIHLLSSKQATATEVKPVAISRTKNKGNAA